MIDLLDRAKLFFAPVDHHLSYDQPVSPFAGYLLSGSCLGGNPRAVPAHTTADKAHRLVDLTVAGGHQR
ncbi:hypothetical protein [Accumulibacter sp.]|uniref:hypothetical protein n=1 Tax=Accumulibacter sp. TaxID=2053492 RepID=UPI00261C60F8|nr:hypothetical protein [Accumulibacter sp.]